MPDPVPRVDDDELVDAVHDLVCERDGVSAVQIDAIASRTGYCRSRARQRVARLVDEGRLDRHWALPGDAEQPRTVYRVASDELPHRAEADDE